MNDDVNRKTNTEKFILIAFCLSGMAALMYEVVWTRLLILIFGSTVYSISAILSAFLAGLALGSYFIGKHVDKIKNHLAAFGVAEFGIGIYGIAFPLLLFKIQYLYFWIFAFFKSSFIFFQAIQFFVFSLILMVPAFLMGATFPLVNKIIIKGFDEAVKKTSYAYAVNSVGSVLGPILASFVFIPMFGVRGTSIVAATVNIIVAVFILFQSRKMKSAVTVSLISIIAIIIGVYAFSEPLKFINFYYINAFSNIKDVNNFLENLQPIFYKEGVYSTVLVTNYYNVVSLRIDGRVDASTGSGDTSNQILLAYVPMLLHRNHEQVLNIGLGGGFTLGALKNFNSQVDLVEIEPSIIEAEKYFSPYNNDALNNTNLHIIVNDARNYLSLTDKKYDVIISEPSHPIISSVNNMFTKEFFHLVKLHLKDDGVFAQWLPASKLNEDEYKIIVNTLLSEFPYVTGWNSTTSEVGGGDTILIASTKLYQLQVDSIENPSIISDLSKVGINSVSDFNFLRLSDFDQTRYYVRDVGRYSTDNLPLLEFSTPKNSFGSK